MKKFLFTLAALLMAVTSFAQTDAKYLYVNTALCEDLGINPATGDHEMLLVISAEFPAYLNAFEAEIHAPEGMTIDLLEVGEDCKVTYYNARGREQTWIPSISIGTGAADQSHFIIAGMQSGYDYVDGVLTDIITVKWAPGLHEEFILATAIIDDEVYHGGEITITTKPASGRDPRQTITDLGDSQQPHTTPATEPLPDPAPVVVAPAAPVITFSGEETTTMTVTVTAVNGSENQDVVPTHEGMVNIMDFVPVHRALVEEYTGTWCGWCTRGLVAMKLLAETYGDDFIGVAYHNGDPMEITTDYPSPVQGFPSAFVDRYYDVDPYYGYESVGFGMKDLVDYVMSQLAVVDLNVKAEWADEGKNELKPPWRATSS